MAKPALQPSEIIGRLSRGNFHFENLPDKLQPPEPTKNQLAVYMELVKLLITEYQILDFDLREAKKIMDKKPASDSDIARLLGSWHPLHPPC